MFNALGKFDMDQGHLDVSFRETENWPSHGTGLAAYNIPPTAYVAFCVGDPVSGPVIELVAASPSDKKGYLLTHLHRCDTFRISLNGEMIMTPGHFGPGEYEFLESGNHYTQGFGPSPEGQWTFLVTADRRGKKEKFANDDRMEKFMAEYAKAHEAPEPTDEPPPDLFEFIPTSFDEDSLGTPAIVTTMGTSKRGVLDGGFSAESWEIDLGPTLVNAALLGDVEAGPVVLLARGEAGALLMPASNLSTEVTVSIIRGSADIGGKAYAVGDVRIQEADVVFESMHAGPDGCDAVIVISDRRAGIATTANDDASVAWVSAVDDTCARLRAELETGVSV